MTVRRVATRSALPEDQGTVAVVGEREIALFRAGEQVYAYPNVCLHKEGPVGEGLVVDGIVTCPWHGRQYDITTGACLNDPGLGSLETIPVVVEGDDVSVDVER